MLTVGFKELSYLISAKHLNDNQFSFERYQSNRFQTIELVRELCL